jgi:hypothetical protein
MEKKYKSLAIAALAIALTASVAVAAKPNRKPFTLKDQGSFTVGGGVITNAGTFDPITSPRPDRPSMATTPISSTRSRAIRAHIRS